MCARSTDHPWLIEKHQQSSNSSNGKFAAVLCDVLGVTADLLVALGVAADHCNDIGLAANLCGPLAAEA
ncbi:hypothetical protein Tco_1333006 [Tanacetum coccineum]